MWKFPSAYYFHRNAHQPDTLMALFIDLTHFNWYYPMAFCLIYVFMGFLNFPEQTFYKISYHGLIPLKRKWPYIITSQSDMVVRPTHFPTSSRTCRLYRTLLRDRSRFLSNSPLHQLSPNIESWPSLHPPRKSSSTWYLCWILLISSLALPLSLLR